MTRTRREGLQEYVLSIQLFWLLLGSGAPIYAAEFFVSPTGRDTNPGTLEMPFATVQRAQDAVDPGDTVSIRGGTYVMKESLIARKQRNRAYSQLAKAFSRREM